ncbi:MAG: (Fe-S)-binding protein [Candidatus Helarchaeota archaeon]
MSKKKPFSRKIRLRLEMCSTCMKMCRDNCPTSIATASESFTPYIRSLHINLNEKGIRPYDAGALESIFSCLTCNLCNTFCLPKVDEEELIKLARASIVESGIDISQYSFIANSISEYHNPLKEPHSSRTDSFKDLLVTDRQSQHATTLLFLGCMSSYREVEIARASIELLRKLNLNFSIMADEWCCGSPSHSTGFIQATRETMTHNVEEWRARGIKTIITPCSACYRTIKTIYPTYLSDFDFEIYHIIEVIERNFSKLSLNSLPRTATFHDPCHLGRGMSMYDAPRRILHKIPAITIIEMMHAREEGFCCGAGGGVRNNFPELSKSVRDIRIDEFLETNAQLLISACPLCKFQLKEGISPDEFEIFDIVELINQLF